MSIKVMTYVWEHSTQSGGALILLLALADFANDEGESWPKIKTLAKKTRLSERHVIRLIQEVEETGELVVVRDEKRNRYWVTLASRDILSPTTDVTHLGDIDVTSYKPSVNRQKETTTSAPVHTVHLGDDQDKDGHLVIQQLRDAGFIYLDKDSRRISSTIETDFSPEMVQSAIDKTIEAHNKSIRSGKRGITAPLGYALSILRNGGAKDDTSNNVINLNTLLEEATW